jgi:hypothetical protein
VHAANPFSEHQHQLHSCFQRVPGTQSLPFGAGISVVVISSAALDLFCLSLGSQAIAVHLARVPESSHEQVLQSSLKTWLGTQVNPGSFTGIFGGGVDGHKRRVQIQTIPFAEHLQRLHS